MTALPAVARGLAMAIACALTVASCTSGSTVADSAPPLPDPNQERVVYVALGGDETMNRELDDPFRDAWTQLVFTTALPRSAVYVNFARPEATVAEAEADQLPQAIAQDPTLATVWLGSGDARDGTSESSFGSDLTETVEALQASGARVLLITAGGDAGGFTDVIQNVAVATSATFVVVPDGDRRLQSTQAAIADAVAAALAT